MCCSCARRSQATSDNREKPSTINLLTAGSCSASKLISRNTTDHWAILAVVFAEPFVVNNVVSWARSDWTSKLRVRPARKYRNTAVCWSILCYQAHSPLNSHTKVQQNGQLLYVCSSAGLNCFWESKSENISNNSWLKNGFKDLLQKI